MESLIYILVLFTSIIQAKDLLSKGNDDTAKVLTNVGCAPYEQVTGTDDAAYQYLPYYVQLYRCQGADVTHAPTHRTCEPTEEKEVKVAVNKDGVHKIITLLNHTKCEYKCKPKVCNKFQKWNEDTCTCGCARNTKATCQLPKVWGGESCCKCSYNAELKCQNLGRKVNTETCECKEKSERSKGGCKSKNIDMQSLLVVVILEFILVVIMCTVVFYCCCHKRFQENSLLSKNMKCHQHQCSNDQLLRLSKDSLVDNV